MSDVVTLWGPLGTGKSTIALTLPGKKFIFDLEKGAKRATWRFNAEEYELWSLPLDTSGLTFSRKDRVIGQCARWSLIVNQFILLLNDPNVGTIVFDTAKELWRTCYE